MSKVLICPSGHAGMAMLGEATPLAATQFLGQSLLEYWLSALACGGVKKVMVLAHDRPERIRSIAGNGDRWGLEVTVSAEPRELTVEEALLKFAPELDGVPVPEAIEVLDHFPGEAARPLFNSYAEWFAGLVEWMPRAVTPDRVGVREVRPGVWMGSHAHVSHLARLEAPCWVGSHVFVGESAVVGPGAIVEDGAFIEPTAEVSQSWVGPDTFVGRLARVTNSAAWGDRLIDWRTGCRAQVPDPFLLCALRQPRRERSPGWFERLAELYARNKDEVHLFWKQLYKES